MSSRAPLRALGGMREWSDRKCIEFYGNMSPKKRTKFLAPCLVFHYERYMAIVVMPSPASHLIKVKDSQVLIISPFPSPLLPHPSFSFTSSSASISSSSSFSFSTSSFSSSSFYLLPPPLPPFYSSSFLLFSLPSLSSCFLNPISHFPYLTFVVRVFLTTLCKIMNISHLFLLQQSSRDSSLSKCILFNLLSTFPHQNANPSKVCSHLVPFSYFP